MSVPHLHLARRTTAIAAVVGAVVVGFGGWALADGGVPVVSSGAPASTTSKASGHARTNTNNVAAANNTKNGKLVIAISLKIVQINSATVDPTNAAVAAASCTDCQTVAIALEGVLVAGSPTTFDPTNIALALNSGCTNCQTLATAYQDVVQHDTRVRISGVGRRRIADVRRDLQALRHSGLDIAAIQQRVDQEALQFLQVLQNDVYPIGRARPTDHASTTTPTALGPTSTSIAPSSSQPATTTTTVATTTTVR